ALVHRSAPPPRVIARTTAAERKELQRRRLAYRGHRRTLPVRGRIVILIDDGVATGATIRASLVVLRRARPARIVVAVPVAAPEAGAALRAEVDEVPLAACPPVAARIGEQCHLPRRSDMPPLAELRSARPSRRLPSRSPG